MAQKPFSNATSYVLLAQAFLPECSLGGHFPIDPRLMPVDGVVPQSVVASPDARTTMISQPSISHHDEDNPHDLVGSQRRREVLPSAPGTPTARTPGIAVAKAQIPQKNSDGKFVCTTLSFPR
jgi:hypothetical protein